MKEYSHSSETTESNEKLIAFWACMISIPQHPPVLWCPPCLCKVFHRSGQTALVFSLFDLVCSWICESRPEWTVCFGWALVWCHLWTGVWCLHILSGPAYMKALGSQAQLQSTNTPTDGVISTQDMQELVFYSLQKHPAKMFHFIHLSLWQMSNVLEIKRLF